MSSKLEEGRHIGLISSPTVYVSDRVITAKS